MSGFDPKEIQQIVIMQHGLGSFHDGPILYFGHTIPLRIIRYNGLLLDSNLLTKINELI